MLHAHGTLPLKVHALRLAPGDDLREQLASLTRQNAIGAGFILAAVGSLSVARLRYAGLDDAAELRGDLEIVALSGTLATGGAVHLHLAVADATGSVRAGHLLTGSLVRTTAEIVVGEAPDLRFTREVDPSTGYLELVPRQVT